MHRFFAALAVLTVFVAGIASLPSAAQVTGAVVSGIVTDAQNAPIPNAQVSVTSTATGETFSTTTNGAGYYEFPSLNPGNYDLTVKAPGFGTYTRSNFELVIQQRLRLDVGMQVASVSESVVVTGTPTVVNTEDARASHTISGDLVANLPFNGRNTYMATRLVPGANISAKADTLANPFDTFAPSNVSFNGTPLQGNQILMDGVVNQFGNGALGFAPSTDAVQEVAVQSFALSAEYGQTGGAVVSMESKSGTNAVHGTLWEFHNDAALNANDFFGNKTGSRKPRNTINQFGGNLGGPIYIPGLYNGRNRSFFFFNYEGIREVFGYRSANTVPTPLERTGDFSQTRAANGQQITIYNPFTTRFDPANPSRLIRDPFPNNIIPPELISPIALNVLKYVPLPNVPGSVNNFIFTNAYSENSDSYQFRFDQHISVKDHLYSSFAQIKRVEDFLSNLPTGVTGWVYPTKSDLWTLGYARIFSPSLIFNLRTGIPFTRQGLDPHTTIADRNSLGLPTSFTSLLRSPDFPSFSNSDMVGFGQSGNAWTFLTPSIHPSATKIAGRHSLEFGYEFQLARTFNHNRGGEAGSFSFGRDWTQGPVASTSSATAGYGVATLLLGVPSSGSVNINANSAAQTLYHAIYLQDKWRLSNKISLNLGLRYDYESPVTERFNRLSRGFDTELASPIAQQAQANYARNPIPELSSLQVKGGLQFVNTGGNSRYNFNPQHNDLMPRLGIVYEIFPKTVLRAGYGIFYLALREVRVGQGVSQAILPLNQTGFSASTAMQTSLNGQVFNTLANPFPQGLVEPVGSSLGAATLLGQSITVYDPNAHRAHSQEFQFSIQHELPWQTLFDVAYVGSRVNDLPVDQSINALPNDLFLSLRDQASRAVPNPFAGLIQVGSLSQATVSLSQLLRPFPEFQNITVAFRPIGSTWYNSLQTSVNKRFSNGFAFLGSYTWSKLMQQVGFLNNYQPLEQVISPIDRTHRFVMTAQWDLPVGKGKKFGSSLPTPLMLAIGNWELTGVTTHASGQPVGFGSGIINTRPLQHIDPTFDKWFDTGAFAPQPAFTLRTLSTNNSQIRADATHNVDLTISKDFPIMERLKFRLMMMMFNAFNTPQFSAPNTSVTSSAFGSINGQANQPRWIQFGAKLLW